MKNGERTIEGYTIEQDYDEEKKKYKDTYSAVSSEEDITILTTDYLYPIDYITNLFVLLIFGYLNLLIHLLFLIRYISD